MKRFWPIIRGVAQVLGRGLSHLVSPRDILLWAGLCLLGYGLSMVWLPAAYIVPGLILAGVAILGVR